MLIVNNYVLFGASTASLILAANHVARSLLIQGLYNNTIRSKLQPCNKNHPNNAIIEDSVTSEVRSLLRGNNGKDDHKVLSGRISTQSSRNAQQ